MDLKNMSRTFIYIPSFSAGSYGAVIKNDVKTLNGDTMRLYSKDVHPLVRHNWFLSPAGHFYKKMDYKESIGIQDGDGVNLLGDSGGFQIATGTIPWSPDLCDKMFRWLEHNATFAINLDIPPKIKYDGKFDECLLISKENFKYFSENQTGRTKFLNVLHGGTPEKYMKWYDEVKGFDFNGWCLGGASVNLSQFMAGIATFIDTGEHKNPKNEMVHFLGISKIIDFCILSQLQHSLNKVDSPITVSTDSSSPSNGTRFGIYYTHADLKKGFFNQLHVPKPKLGLGEDMIEGTLLPWTTSVDDYLVQGYDYNDLFNMTNRMYGILVLHNFAVFREACKRINELVYGHPYLMEQMINKDIVSIMKLVDKMVLGHENGDLAIETFKKSKPLIDYVSSRTVENQSSTLSTNDFF